MNAALKAGAPLLRVTDLAVQYREHRHALQGISLELGKGGALGICGESGSGKSTLVRALLGLVPIAQGEIHWYGRSMATFGGKEWRALRRTVPTAARTEELTDITSWLGELVRGVDSSLLDEWEALAHPDVDELILPGHHAEVRPPLAARGISANERGFTVMVRNALFRRVELLARDDYATLGELHGSQGWRADSWESAMHGYWAEYDALGIGAAARAAGLVLVDRMPEKWHVRQIFDDPAGDHDWGLSVEIDLAASDEEGEPVLTILDLGPATG